MTEQSAVAVAATRLRLLGGWQLVVDGADVELGHREQRLVSLLGLQARSARAQVASTLWPDSTDERALASLRRAVLQCQQRCPGLLEATRLTAALAPGVQVDVDDLRRAAALTRLPMTDLVARELLTALRGSELLPGWYDDWAVEERGQLEQLRTEALERVASYGLEQGDPELAIDAARSASEMEPLRELPREVSIRAHLHRGDVAGAMHEFRRYSNVLHDEVGVAPSARVMALVEPLRDDAARPTSGPPSVTHQRSTPPGERVVGDEPDEEPALEPAHDWAPTSLDDFLDGKHRGRPGRVGSGVRRVATALVGVAGIALAVSLAVAWSGPDQPTEATGDPSASVPTDRVPPSPRGRTAPSRTVHVLPIDAIDGSAVFAVRASRRPAQVRFVVRGPAGLRVVRHLVVRDATGRDVVVHGLDPGTYTWSATSATAAPVSGEVSVATPAAEAAEPHEPSTSVTPDVTQVTSPASQAPETTPTPSSTATTTPSPTPTSSPPPSPSPSHSPPGTPRDPGTVAPPPVG
jgi:DNA-binding SARP family transcriptional activator